MSKRAASCEEKAFVEATPISGPASVSTVWSAILARELEGTLTRPRVRSLLF